MPIARITRWDNWQLDASGQLPPSPWDENLSAVTRKLDEVTYFISPLLRESQMDSEGKIFVWRCKSGVSRYGPPGPNIEFPPDFVRGVDCPWCQHRLLADPKNYRLDGPPGGSSDEEFYCDFCGWERGVQSQWAREVGWGAASWWYRILRKFAIDSPLVSLSELGAHLESNFSDVYGLSFRRFEELIEDIFKNLGYITRLTQQTRDGGADIVLLDDTRGNLAIVEVKRFAPDRTVGIGIVDRLLGAALRWNVRRAYLVTSSQFTKNAAEAKAQLIDGRSDLELELWDAGRIITELGCYNTKMPPLELIDPKVTKRNS